MAEDLQAVKDARRAAHRAFDRLWKTKQERTNAYVWLAKEMGLRRSQCHIELFGIQQCKEVIRLSQERNRKERG